MASRGAYQSLLYESGDFMGYFRASTPIDVIERIGSRSERAEHLGEVQGEPSAALWIFAWTQNRCLLPSWFGVATGLNVAIDKHGEETIRVSRIWGWRWRESFFPKGTRHPFRLPKDKVA